MDIFSRQRSLSPTEWHLALPDALTAMNYTPHASTGFAPYEVVFNQSTTTYDLEDRRIPDSKCAQRKFILTRLRRLKMLQAEKSGNSPTFQIPMLEKDTIICVKYSPRDPKFYAKVICDHGLSLTIVRFDPKNLTKLNQHAKIKVAKRHVYVPKFNDFSTPLANIIYTSICSED